MVKYQIVWTTRSQQNMRSLYNYIKKKSLQNAQSVCEAIIAAVEKAAINPEFYNADKYKLNNDGTYRAFEKKSYRVSYRFSKNTVRILCVRRTSMKPKFY